MHDHPPEPGKYLRTLAYRCTPELLGDTTVHLRRLDSDTTALWRAFTGQCQRRFGNREAQAPYSIATTVLQAITGGYVFFEPTGEAPFLVSRVPIESGLLRKAFALTYGLALGESIEAIDLRRPSALAERIAQTPEQELALRDHLDSGGFTQPNAPNWLYKSVGWGLAERLASRPFTLSNGREITLRPDTTGGLVAVDDPWVNDRGGRYALCRTSVRLKTLPNIHHPVLLLGARVSRISQSLIFSSTALAVQTYEGRPILQIELNGRGGAKTIPRQALQALGRLELDYSILRAIDERSQHEQRQYEQAKANKEKPRFSPEYPGRIWPIPKKNHQHPIGTGVGMHHLRLLHSHAMEVFGDAAAPLQLRQTVMTMPRRPTDPEKISNAELERRREERKQSGSKEPLRRRGSLFPSPESLWASVEDTGFKQLRIVCLWYRDETRQRMLQALTRAFGLAPEGLDLPDGHELDLHQGRVHAIFYKASDFLEPALDRARSEHLGPAKSSLKPEDDVLIGAWCETEVPDVEDFPDLEPQQLDAADAKPPTKSILAQRGIASQYLKGRDSNGAIAPQTEDHPAQMALLDLFRSLGAVDERIANAVEGTSTFAVEKLAHIGVHVRQQNRRSGERGEPKVVITATALVPPHTPSRTWSLLGWSSTDPVWKPYHAAQNTFHASNYPPPSASERNYRAKWDEAAQTVEQALADFVETQDGLSYTVTVDANAARRMWDGLQNMRLGAQPAGTGASDRGTRLRLPGERLGADAPVAVIRLNIEDAEVPRPVGVIRRGKMPGAEPVDQETSTLLFEIDTDFGTPAWLLSNVPRNYDGNSNGGRRLGSKRTRWEVNRSVYSEEPEQRRKGEMGQNFYSMTATEILPIGGPSDEVREALAAMTARLCHQTMYWSDRARYPVPLHAAQQMDADHPQHRRDAIQDEQ